MKSSYSAMRALPPAPRPDRRRCTRRQPFTRIALDHFMHQRHQNPAAGGADGPRAIAPLTLTRRSSTPVPGQRRSPERRRPHWLRSDRRRPAASRPAPDSGGWRWRAPGDAHRRRIDPDAGEGADPRGDRQPQFLGFRFTHHHHRRRAVIDAGGVAGGHRSETIEGGLQAGQPFRAGIHPRLFIGIHGARRAVMLGNDRDNLIAKASGINRLARLLLRAERPGVLQFAADAIFGRGFPP